uniref:Uncharacterized protein n=1 Tax=Verrucosispora sp. MS100047 TaxID=1410949 RepID=A0A097CSE8_9ACTN|nr:hypothetical protein VASRM7_338 [Verrucosispora sp. MS100047]
MGPACHSVRYETGAESESGFDAAPQKHAGPVADATGPASM